MRTYRASRDLDIDKCISSVLPLIHEAGNPYFDWLFGGPSVALPIIASQMRSPASEISIQDAVVVADPSGDVIGCIIALEGSELSSRRISDAVAYLKHVGNSGRAGLLRRMQESRELFASVRPHEFYLSKVGVRADARGRGYGRALVERFLSMGREQGLSRFALDVSGQNKAATELYTSMGFQIVRESFIQGSGITYITMRLDD